MFRKEFEEAKFRKICWSHRLGAPKNTITCFGREYDRRGGGGDRGGGSWTMLGFANGRQGGRVDGDTTCVEAQNCLHVP